MAAVHILIFGEMAGFKIVHSNARENENFFHGAMKKKFFSQSELASLHEKTTDIKLLNNRNNKNNDQHHGQAVIIVFDVLVIIIIIIISSNVVYYPCF